MVKFLHGASPLIQAIERCSGRTHVWHGYSRKKIGVAYTSGVFLPQTTRGSPFVWK
jgi:hypothetical protein